MHYEHIKPGETISGDHYRQQLNNLRGAIAEKRPKRLTIWKAAAVKLCLARFIVQTLTENSIALDGQTFE